MSIPVFTTPRLILRPLQLIDGDDFFEYAQDERVARPGMWEPYSSYEACANDLASLVSRYESGLRWWGLEHREDRKLIGRVQLSRSRGDECSELSYAMHFNYWGQGLMSEALAPVLAFGWNDLKLHRLEATALTTNPASIQLLTKIGMKHEGTLIGYRYLYGEWHDVELYATVAR